MSPSEFCSRGKPWIYLWIHLWIYSRLEANTDLCEWLQNFCRLFLTGKYFAVVDNIRNKSECVPPKIELGICGFTVDWKPIYIKICIG